MGIGEHENALNKLNDLQLDWLSRVHPMMFPVLGRRTIPRPTEQQVLFPSSAQQLKISAHLPFFRRLSIYTAVLNERAILPTSVLPLPHNPTARCESLVYLLLVTS
jgi:hypothetical protein